MDHEKRKTINVNLKMELQYGERNCYLEGNLKLKTDRKNCLSQEDCRKTIRRELKGLGFPADACGTTYLEEGIYYCISEPEHKISITKELYPIIAEKYNTNAANVESNIRSTIEKVWSYGDLQLLREIESTKTDGRIGRPTNGRLIHTLARKVEEGLQEYR